MNTKQLYQALIFNKYTNECFNGVYSLDTLEDIEAKPKLIICNTDPSNKPGKHWVLFYFEKDNVEFFDSLGKSIDNYGIEFLRFARKFAKTISQSQLRVQAKNTDTCGQYCLYYAYLRCKGNSMESIIIKMQTVKIIMDVVKSVFKFCLSSSCSMLQNCIAC